MDFQFILKHLPAYIVAMKLTFFLATIGIILSIIVGMISSLILYYKIPIVNKIVQIYVELSRNTPLVIQLFFLYFGLPKIGVHIGSYESALIGLTFLGGSYMCEAIRGGLESVTKGQIESGLSIGLNNFQLIKNVILPQALQVALPGIGANIIFLLKETSVVGIVALADLMFVTKDLIGIYYKTSEALLMLVISYLVLILPISIILTIVERRLRYATKGN